MKRILLIDDDADVLESTSALLELDGYEVHATPEASRLEKELITFQPDVVLHDVHMPGLDLPAAIRLVRATRPGTPIILFTGAPDGAAINTRTGADGLLAKPFRIEELQALMRRAYRFAKLI